MTDDLRWVPEMDRFATPSELVAHQLEYRKNYHDDDRFVSLFVKESPNMILCTRYLKETYGL